jgi:tRNA A37 methylthiotransferase MiaB
MKIKFLLNQVNNPYHITINPLFFFIKTYYDIYGMNGQVEWLRCEHVIFNSVDESAESIVAAGVNVLGLSVFIWNEDYQHAIAKKVKELDPNIVIVFGGPQLDAHKNLSFFKTHPYVDWVCYGDGERAFQLLIDKISNLYNGPLINVVENVNGNTVVHDYEIISDEKYLSTGALIAQKDIILDTLEYLKEHDITNKQLFFAVEFARGCMYSCSFCDWSQNLTKKVKRRTHNWRAEIDLLHELDVSVRETDANFGQWKQDIEIFDYAVSLYDPARTFKFVVSNTSKLNKDATFYIMSTQAKKYNAPAVVSIQDFDADVLKNIDRPGLNYEQQVDFIKRLLADLHDKTYLVTIQIIIGLPGQTYESIKNTVIKTYELGISNHMIFPFAYLINSPAADKMYERMHGLKWKKTFGLNGYYENINYSDIPVNTDNLESLYIKASNSELVDGMWASSTTLYETNTLSFRDYIRSHIFITLSKQFQRKMVENKLPVNYKKMYTVFDSKVEKLTDHYLAVHGPLIEKYNVYMMAIPDVDSKVLNRFSALI